MMHAHDLQVLIDNLFPINPSDDDYSDICCIKDVFFDALSTHPRVLAVHCRLTVPKEHVHARETPSFRSQENLLIQSIDEFKDEVSIDQRIKREQRQRTYGSDAAVTPLSIPIAVGALVGYGVKRVINWFD